MTAAFGVRWGRRGLQTRIVLLTVVGMLSPMAILGWASWASLEELNRQLLTGRQELATSFATHLEYVVRSELETLQGVSSAPRVDLEDRDPAPERAALREAYLRSHLLRRVFLLGGASEVLWDEPARDRLSAASLRDLPAAREAFRTGKPTVSPLVGDGAGAPRLYAFVPLRNWRGDVAGLVGGEIDPQSPRFTSLLQLLRPGRSASTDLVDGRGVVLASTDPRRLFRESDHGEFIAGLIRERRAAVGTCHGCHESHVVRDRVREAMAFAPLTVAPWGIGIRQPEEELFAAASDLRRRMLRLAPLLLGLALLFAWGAARSIRNPLAVLTEAAERIASGKMNEAIPPLGEDEVGRLGRSFETMRAALKASMDAVARANLDLERRVEERTGEIERLYRELREREEWRGRLLRKVISAQEDERKRIARELHDDTSQALAALAVRLETAVATLPAGAPRERIEEAKALALQSLEGLHRLIFDLRPSVLDDLGLLSAIRWCAERHLEALGIAVRCEFSGMDRHLPPQVETALFRAAQEAIVNIAKHAEAETVLIQCALRERDLAIEIEDDGKGFDLQSLTRAGAPARGLGLLGIRERVELLGGTVEIESSPGQGTRVALAVPLPAEESDA